jgi:very-short-patch-repair endonuclease
MMVGAVRVTSPLWTLRTLGEVADVTTVELAVESALRLRQVGDDDLWRLAGEGPGTRALEWVLRTRGRGSRPTGSWLETRALQLVLRPAGIEVVARQVDIYEGDFWHARPDFLLPGWTILEVDGRQHADVVQKRHDNDRDLRLCGLGLRVVRLDAVQIREARTHAGRRLQRVIDEGRRAHAGAPPPLVGGCLRF